MIWGYMAHGRLGPLMRIAKGERKGDDYVRSVLACPLWRFYVDFFEERGIVALMEDGAPNHKSQAENKFPSCTCHGDLPVSTIFPRSLANRLSLLPLSGQLPQRETLSRTGGP